MKKRLIALIPYMIILILNFYLLPLLVKDTGMAMFIMLCIIPIITFCCSVAYGVRQGFNLYLPVTVALLFAPTIFIYYNYTAWVYIIVYALISLVGTGIGRLFYQKR